MKTPPRLKQSWGLLVVFEKSLSFQEEAALIRKARQEIFMAEIRENFYMLFALQVVVYGKVAESRTTLILKAGSHQNFCLNHGCEVLYIQISELFEVFFHTLVLRIVKTENVFQFLIGSSSSAAAVDTVKIRQEGEHDSGFPDLRE